MSKEEHLLADCHRWPKEAAEAITALRTVLAEVEATLVNYHLPNAATRIEAALVTIRRVTMP